MKHPIIIAACVAMLLSACDNSKTPEAADVPKPSGTDAPAAAKLPSPRATLAPGASKQERIEWLNKMRDDYMNVQPGQTPSSPAAEDE